jgi:hypothetical protein
MLAIQPGGVTHPILATWPKQAGSVVALDKESASFSTARGENKAQKYCTQERVVLDLLTSHLGECPRCWRGVQ